MIRVEVGEHDVPDVVLTEPERLQALRNPTAKIEDHTEAVQLQQHGGAHALLLELARAGAQQDETITHRCQGSGVNLPEKLDEPIA